MENFQYLPMYIGQDLIIYSSAKLLLKSENRNIFTFAATRCLLCTPTYLSNVHFPESFYINIFYCTCYRRRINMKKTDCHFTIYYTSFLFYHKNARLVTVLEKCLWSGMEKNQEHWMLTSNKQTSRYTWFKIDFLDLRQRSPTELNR